MTRRWFVTLALASLSGCIVYDGDGDCPLGCGDGGSATLWLEPDTMQAGGEAVLRVGWDGSFDPYSVDSAEVAGPVHVTSLGYDDRGDLLLFASAAADAYGTYDVILYRSDGAALVIYGGLWVNADPNAGSDGGGGTDGGGTDGGTDTGDC